MTVASAGEQLTIEPLTAGTRWIGASEPSPGVIEWVTGEAITFSGFPNGLPDGPTDACIAITPGGWNDQPCGATNPSICEYE